MIRQADINRQMKPTRAKQDTGSAARPVELIQYDTTTGKFSVGHEALAALRSVNTPVAVVAVCGRARQGKSFILNQLLGRSQGFQVAPTHRPCTKGLWMWSSPIPRKGPEGTPYHLVLLDTEGIDAYDQTGQYSTQVIPCLLHSHTATSSSNCSSSSCHLVTASCRTELSPACCEARCVYIETSSTPTCPCQTVGKQTIHPALRPHGARRRCRWRWHRVQIFSLAVLLSSMFVYNQMGGIDEAALDRLSLVTEMTKHIRLRSSEGASPSPCAPPQCAFWLFPCVPWPTRAQHSLRSRAFLRLPCFPGFPCPSSCAGCSMAIRVTPSAS